MTRPSLTRPAADADAEVESRGAASSAPTARSPPRFPRGREQVERIARRREARGRRVEGGADVAQRQEHLGREHEHEQPGHERHVAADQPQPDRHGDERHREARGELEREPREERDAQHLHGACAIVIGHRADAGDLPFGAAERHEGRQPADDLEEAPRQRGEALPLPPLHGLGRHADERHEHRDQRQHDHEHEARQRVGDPHRDDEHGRRDHRQHELRQVGAEVRVERVEPGPQQRGDARGREAGHPCRSRLQRGEQFGSQFGLHPHGTRRTDEVPRPRGEGANGCRDHEYDEQRPGTGHPHAVDQSRDERRERPGEGDDRRRLDEREPAARGEERAGGPRAADEPRIERFHVSALPPRSMPCVTRLRNTQYVQP